MSKARDLADQVSNLITISTGGSNFVTPEVLSASIALVEPNILYSSASPNTASVGSLWVDTTNASNPALKVYNGSEWKLMSGAGGGGMATTLMTIGAS